MMTESLKGKTRAEAEALFERFHALITGDPARPGTGGAELGKLAVFSGVCEFPVRVKCAVAAVAHAEGRARGSGRRSLDGVKP